MSCVAIVAMWLTSPLFSAKIGDNQSPDVVGRMDLRIAGGQLWFLEPPRGSMYRLFIRREPNETRAEVTLAIERVAVLDQRRASPLLGILLCYQQDSNVCR